MDKLLSVRQSWFCGTQKRIIVISAVVLILVLIGHNITTRFYTKVIRTDKEREIEELERLHTPDTNSVNNIDERNDPDIATKVKINTETNKIDDSKIETDKEQTLDPEPGSNVKVMATQSLKSSCPNKELSEIPRDKQTFYLVEGRPVYVFSAYLDTRRDLSSTRILIIAAGLQTQFNDIPPMHCILWYQGKPGTYHGTDGGEAKYDVIYRSILYADMYTIHYVICDVEEGDSAPVAVSVTDQPCGKHTHVLPLQQTTSAEPMYEFSHCTSPLYGKVPVDLMIEYIEIHRILGVEKFTFYKTVGVSRETLKTLDYYKKLGIVEVVNWDFPNVRQSYFMQRVALNDCLYRNMANTKYLGIYDLDEIAVPKQDDTWEKLFEKLTRSKADTGAFIFQHAYFRREYSSDVTLHLVTQESRWRTQRVFPEGKIRSKTVYKPERVYSVDIHFPYTLLPQYTELIVDSELGMLHHYRLSEMAINKNMDYTEDRSMMRYGTQLLKQVTIAHKAIYNK